MTTTTRITISLGQRTGSPSFRATQDAVEESVASLVAGMEPDAEVTVTSRDDDGADVVEVDGDRQHPTAREIKDRLGEADWEAEQDAIAEAQHDAEQAKAQRPEVIAAAQAKHDEQILQADGLVPALDSAESLEDLLGVVPHLSESDLTSLPTFGGAEPSDTHGVFSWDDTRLLVQDRTGYRIRPRQDVYRVSLNNGSSYRYAPELAEPEVAAEVRRLYDAVVNQMDDAARELAHGAADSDDPVAFVALYMQYAPHDLVIG